MTPGQRAIVAAKAMKAMPERRGGDRRSEKARDQKARTVPFDSAKTYARTFKVGENSIKQAKAVLDEAPDLAERSSVPKWGTWSACWVGPATKRGSFPLLNPVPASVGGPLEVS